MWVVRSKRTSLALTALLGGVVGSQLRSKSNDASSHGLNTSTFTPYTLIKKDRLTSTNSVFNIRPDISSSENVQDLYNKGIWSVQIKQPQLQIARNYTPLPPLTTSPHDDELCLLIRREQSGEVSNYLHNLPPGDTVEVRGPTIEYELPEDVQQVIFLAGGTGIAPALQVAHALQRKSSISILWANRSREESLGGRSSSKQDSSEGWLSGWKRLVSGVDSDNSTSLAKEEDEPANTIVKQLRHMQRRHSGDTAHTMEVAYFVDDEKSFITTDSIKMLVEARVGTESATGSKLIFVSGPEGFVKYWAGPKQWANGREVQGPLGGVLGRLGLTDWRVIKL